MAIGDVELVLADTTPQWVLNAIDPFSTVAVLPTRIDSARASWTSIMAAALFSGYLTARPERTTFSGPSIAAYLGDADGAAGSWTTCSSTSAHAVSYFVALALHAAPKAANQITVGTVTDPATAKAVQWTDVTPRAALGMLVALWASDSVEWRVNPDGTLDAGPADALYSTATARALASRLGGGRDATIIGLDTPAIAVEADWEDYATVIRATADSAYSYVATAATVPYKDHAGNPLTRVRQISYSTDTATAVALAGAQMLTAGQRRSLKLNLDDYDVRDLTGTRLRVGHAIAVYDPLIGISDASNPMRYRGQIIAPELIRIVAWDRPIRSGYGVYLKRSTGAQAVIDLTPYIQTTEGAGTVTVDWLPRALPDSTSRNPGSVVVSPIAPDPVVTTPPDPVTTPPISWTNESSSIVGATSGTLTPGYLYHASTTDANGYVTEVYVATCYGAGTFGSPSGTLKFSIAHAAPAAAAYLGSGVLYYGTDWNSTIAVGCYACTGDLSNVRLWKGSGTPPADGSGSDWVTGAGPTSGVTWENTSIQFSLYFHP